MKLSILSLATALGLATALIAPTALAGAGHGPQHGGVAREAMRVTYELVARPDSLTLYVSDHGRPLPTRGATAEAVVYAGNDKIAVKLEPAGGNRMAARGAFKVGVGVRVVVTATLPGKPAARVSFSLK